MTPPLTAYIDMEFAGIRGTRQGMQIPTEIGVVLHNPATDTLSFAGKAFCHDIEVEVWKNVTDDLGKRVDGYRRTFNLARPAVSIPDDKKSRLTAEGTRHARAAIGAVHRDVKTFMQALNHRNISTLVFFAKRRELETFQQARVNLDGFLIRDLQTEIRHEYELKEDVSLDRMSLVIGFILNGKAISSSHFSCSVENLDPNKLYEPVKVSENDLARDFLLLNLEYPGFQISSEPSF
jgi:HAMP domain-containing protein